MSPRADDAYTFSVATAADEPEIRRLVGSVVMPGSLPVRFEREPDYFLGTPLMGDPCDVLIARHQPDGELAGVVCHAIRTHLVNGEPRTVGWIGQVRAAPRHQGRWLLHRGLPLLRERGGVAGLHLAVVASDNRRARAVMLERRPPGGLHARRVCGLTTRALLLRGGQGTWDRIQPPPPGLAITTGAHVGAPALVEFLRRVGARRQLFPAWSVDDLLDGRTLRGLELRDIAVAVDPDGLIRGTMGCWDQRAFKQDIVAGYPAPLARVRSAWNVLGTRSGAPRLPPPGTAIPQALAALICITDDDPAVLRTLLEQTARRAARRGCGFLLVGLADADPLAAGMHRWPCITYRSDLFAFSWVDPVPGADLDGRVPSVEIGTL